MIQVHEWRKAFNGSLLGRGFDPYRPDEEHQYPEAYALWGSGYVSLYRLTGVSDYLSTAVGAADWLLDHPSPGYRNFSWGLPWSWEKWQTPNTLSYLITTVFAGELLLKLYEVTGKSAYLDSAQSVASWIEEENGGKKNISGRWLYYANFAPLRFPIVNVNAKASGYFAKLYGATRNVRYQEPCMQIVRWVLEQENQNGR
jgi:uncharacterized protein YyaL (SSP411 family)